jgi:methionyl aminopeptidase
MIMKQPTVKPGTISPMAEVPAHIPKPEYAAGGLPSPCRLSCRKETEEQRQRMRHAGCLAREVLDRVLDEVRPGVTTDHLDRLAHRLIVSRGAYPSPLNYMGFPKSICTSVNEVVVHGIPDSRPLEEGDIVNCDVTVYVDGMHGDCSETVFVGKVDDRAQRLVRVAWECLLRGIEAAGPGRRLNLVGLAVEAHARSHGYSVVREFCGHGIGEHFHMAPYVAHFHEPDNDVVLVEGMTLTIEPMLNEGTAACVIWPDHWTAVTADCGLSAQFEHTLLVVGDGVEILTGGRTPRFLA